MSAEGEARSRSCPGCGTRVAHRMTEADPLQRAPCPRCGAEVLFTRYERMDIALGEYCNLRCVMCRRPSEARFMDKGRCKRAITEAALVGIRTVSFSGGEPFVHPDFREILEHAFSTGLAVQLVSNGTLIREEHLELLSALDCLTISIDGTEAAHDRIRRRPGTYRRSMKTLRMLTQKSRIQWGTNTVMQRDNAHCLYDSFAAIQALGGLRYAYCGFSHVEVVPATAHLQMTPAQERSAQEQIQRVARECERTHTWFNERELLLQHFEMYARKDRRYRPIDGCRIPQKFVGLSDHGYYLCWHQGRNIEERSLVAALDAPLAREVVRDGLHKRCVACNGFNYAWDEEWNQGMIASALAQQGVEVGVVPLGVPSAAGLGEGATPGDTLEVHEL